MRSWCSTGSDTLLHSCSHTLLSRAGPTFSIRRRASALATSACCGMAFVAALAIGSGTDPAAGQRGEAGSGLLAQHRDKVGCPSRFPSLQADALPSARLHASLTAMSAQGQVCALGRDHVDISMCSGALGGTSCWHLSKRADGTCARAGVTFRVCSIDSAKQSITRDQVPGVARGQVAGAGRRTHGGL